MLSLGLLWLEQRRCCPRWESKACIRPRLNKTAVVHTQGYADDEGTGILTSVGQNTPPPSPKATAEDHGFAADDDDKERVPIVVSVYKFCMGAGIYSGRGEGKITM